MSSHVDYIKADISGISETDVELLIQTFELNVAINSIPSITLEVLPVDAKDIRAGDGRKTTASSPSFEEITRLYSRLTELARDLDHTADITLEISSTGEYEKETDQKITLSQWVLSDVGISSITSYSAPVLSVVFSHPVIRIDRTGMIYELPLVQDEGINEEYDNLVEAASEGGIISVMDRVYDFYANGSIDFFEIADMIRGGSDERAKDIVISQRTRLSENLPGKYIECNMEDIFMEKILSRDEGVGELLRETVLEILEPKAFGKSTWGKLISEICPLMMMNIVPTYDKNKLILEPFSPWQECSIVMDNSKMQAIDVTSVDPNPIIGAAIEKDPYDRNHVTGGSIRTTQGKAQEVQEYSHAFFFPEGVTEERPIGGIINVGENIILENVLSRNWGVCTNGESTQQNHKISLEPETRAIADTAYAQAVFLSNYRKQCKAAITSIPCFRDWGGNMIYPGRVMTVYDPNTYARILYGYLSRMVIKGSVQGGGSAYFEMMYARPTESGSILVKEGTPNPCYEQPSEDQLDSIE